MNASAVRPRLAFRTFAISLPQLWAFLAVSLPVVASLASSLSTVDLAYNIRAGQLMLTSGRLLSLDPFTFTVGGSPWLDQQWAAQVVFAGVYAVGGWVGLALLRATVAGAIYLLVFAACEAGGAGPRTAALLTLASFAVSLVALALRPQVLGMFLFAFSGWIVAGTLPGSKRLLALPILAALWANVHGSFVLAPALAAMWWLQAVVAKRPGARLGVAVPVLTAAATLLNPHGIGAWTYAIDLSTNPEIRHLLVEWQPTSVLGYPGMPFAASVVLALAALHLGRRSGGAAWPMLGWLVALAVLGFSAERGVVWWALGAPSVVAGLLGLRSRGRRPLETRQRPSLLNTAVAAVVVLGGIVALPCVRATPTASNPEPLLADAPAGLASAVGAAVPGQRALVPEAWASWFELAAPGVPLFVDSRIELYPAAVWDDYLTVQSGWPRTATILDRWQVSIVVARSRSALEVAMRGMPEWRPAYRDPDGTVFERISANG